MSKNPILDDPCVGWCNLGDEEQEKLHEGYLNASYAAHREGLKGIQTGDEGQATRCLTGAEEYRANRERRSEARAAGSRAV